MKRSATARYLWGQVFANRSREKEGLTLMMSFEAAQGKNIEKWTPPLWTQYLYLFCCLSFTSCAPNLINMS